MKKIWVKKRLQVTAPGAGVEEMQASTPGTREDGSLGVPAAPRGRTPVLEGAFSALVPPALPSRSAGDRLRCHSSQAEKGQAGPEREEETPRGGGFHLRTPGPAGGAAGRPVRGAFLALAPSLVVVTEAEQRQHLCVCVSWRYAASAAPGGSSRAAPPHGLDVTHSQQGGGLSTRRRIRNNPFPQSLWTRHSASCSPRQLVTAAGE